MSGHRRWRHPLCPSIFRQPAGWSSPDGSDAKERGMTTTAAPPNLMDSTTTENPEQKRLALLSLFAAGYTYLLVVFGGIVRITGSGLGCGDDWPRCNGEWIPTFTLETLIEYTHRMLAAGIGLVVLSVFGYALLRRRSPGVAGRGGMIGPLTLAAVLLVFQAGLGAVTVRLELPTSVTVAHFITAMFFLATLIEAAARGGALGRVGGNRSPAALKTARWASIAAGLGLIVVAFGALTANTPAAPGACAGFPLCNGSLLPTPGLRSAEIHWAHRLVAFSVLFVALAASYAARRNGAARPVVRAGFAAVLLILVQLGVAAALVLLRLPQSLQALHLAVGAAVWFALAAWAALARLDTRSTTSFA
jgi:heme a synthase